MGPSLKMIIEKITSMIVISYGFKDDHIKSLPFHTHRTIFEPQRIPSEVSVQALPRCSVIPSLVISDPVYRLCFPHKNPKKIILVDIPSLCFPKKIAEICGYMWNPHISPYLPYLLEVQ